MHLHENETNTKTRKYLVLPPTTPVVYFGLFRVIFLEKVQGKDGFFDKLDFFEKNMASRSKKPQN